MSNRLTSADIQDGKTEFDRRTGATILYKIIPGGWTKTTTTPQPNGTKKSETQTFYDPVPVTDEEEIKKLQNRTDGKTTVEHRKIRGGREEIYTTVFPDGTSSTQVKTFYENADDAQRHDENKKKNTPLQKVRKQDSQDSQHSQTSHHEVQQYNRKDSRTTAKQDKNLVQQFSEETVEEHRRVTKVSGKQITKTDSVDSEHNVKTTGRKIKKTDSLEEHNSHAIITTSDKKDVTKKKKRTPAPPPPTLPPEFADGKTTVTSKKINGGTEYTYTTVNKQGNTMTSTKTVYEEEEIEMTDEEIKQYQKQLKDAKKHENIQNEKTLKTKDGSIKKIVPSDNPGDVTTVEEKRIPGGTEYHYTTVTKEGIVKKYSKTIYDPKPVEKKNGDETSEEEIIEEYEEEVISPGDQITKTIVKNVQMVKEEKRETYERITTGSVVVSDQSSIQEHKRGRKAIKN